MKREQINRAPTAVLSHVAAVLKVQDAIGLKLMVLIAPRVYYPYAAVCFEGRLALKQAKSRRPDAINTTGQWTSGETDDFPAALFK
jgi:hypothetical protein